MSRPPIPPVSKIARSAGVATATSGSASLAAFAAASKSTVAVGALTVLIVASAIAICLPKIFESIYKRRAAVIREKNIAQVLRKEADTRHELAVAGLDPSKTEQAKEMLRQLAITPALPKDQRLSDETYRELLKPGGPAKAAQQPADLGAVHPRPSADGKQDSPPRHRHAPGMAGSAVTSYRSAR